MTIQIEKRERVTTVVLDRAGARNAVDGPTAEELVAVFRAFDADPESDVAVLCGANDTFCAGADLKAVSGGFDTASVANARANPSANARANPLNEDMAATAPMGCTRLLLTKPVIAAVSGYAVAGGMELALWCDLRVVEETATFGIFCRRWGVPLIDGGTVRLPRLIGQSRAMDMILTGRPVGAAEAFDWGLANRVVPDGSARAEAQAMAAQLAAFPQRCMRADRLSSIAQWGMDQATAIREEFIGGREVMRSGETVAGATRFHEGKGRHGRFE